MMGTDVFNIDASWSEKLTKMSVSFLMTPTVAAALGEEDLSDSN